MKFAAFRRNTCLFLLSFIGELSILLSIPEEIRATLSVVLTIYERHLDISHIGRCLSLHIVRINWPFALPPKDERCHRSKFCLPFALTSLRYEYDIAPCEPAEHHAPGFGPHRGTGKADDASLCAGHREYEQATSGRHMRASTKHIHGRSRSVPTPIMERRIVSWPDGQV